VISPTPHVVPGAGIYSDQHHGCAWEEFVDLHEVFHGSSKEYPYDGP
jgi:hypothetical protein